MTVVLAMIARIVLFIVILNGLWALLSPKNKAAPPDSSGPPGKVNRFSAENNTIEDAEYDDVT